VELRELNDALEARQPDLLVLGPTAGGIAAGDMLKALATKRFDGKVPPSRCFRPCSCRSAKSACARASRYSCPKNRLAPWWTWPKPCAAAGSSFGIGPKIDARAVVMRGVEALLRIRHPAWGIVPPAYLVAADGDPRCAPLSESVISRAVDD
jgi:hypothetical protein